MAIDCLTLRYPRPSSLLLSNICRSSICITAICSYYIFAEPSSFHLILDWLLVLPSHGEWFSWVGTVWSRWSPCPLLDIVAMASAIAVIHLAWFGILRYLQHMAYFAHHVALSFFFYCMLHCTIFWVHPYSLDYLVINIIYIVIILSSLS